MKPQSKQIYGSKRVLTRLEHMVDPLVLAGLDEIARRRGVSRAQCVRDALYTAVYRALREEMILLSSPSVPFARQYDGLATVRIVSGKTVIVDQHGLPTDKTLADALRELADSLAPVPVQPG